ncbi:MAG: GTPase Era [Oribacterium sp.]
MPMTKSGFVALVGRPNVGKSTLMNGIVGQKIAITSRKPQTTRNQIMAVYDDARGQIVFHDTPGIHKAKNKLSEYMDHVAEKALGDVDLVLWLVEPSSFIGEGERHIAEVLSHSRKKKVLVINKIDTLKDKEKLDEIIGSYRQLLELSDVIAVSAYRKQGIEELKDLIYRFLPEGPRYYDEDTVTDMPMRDIAAELIREQALYKLDNEVPHGIAVLIEEMKQRPNGLWDIKASIICEREAHKGIIIGKGGAMLKRIGTGARLEIEKLVENRVNLSLFVKVRRDWRENSSYLKEYGYREDKERY